jgi:fido (protein-threonine AMPylation protein)
MDIKLGGTIVKFASLEDVIIHKIFSGRPRDLEDIKSILVKNPKYNSHYVSRWLKEFDRSLDENFLETFRRTEEQARIKPVILGRAGLRAREEEEVRGYRDALKLIHERGAMLPVPQEIVLTLHRLCRGEIWVAGKYKEKDGDIIERYVNGRERVRFRTVSAAKTPSFIKGLIETWNQCLEERWGHPLIGMGAFNLDFICIHPFRDGNGRISRLLLQLQCYHLGYDVGRYISLERLIEDNKDRYYETLELSSERWHEGKHDPWPYVNYVLYILKAAYRGFEHRVGQMKTPAVQRRSS